MTLTDVNLVFQYGSNIAHKGKQITYSFITLHYITLH